MPSNAIARILPDSPARAALVRAELDGITGTAHAHPREAVALAGLARAMDDLADYSDVDPPRPAGPVPVSFSDPREGTDEDRRTRPAPVVSLGQGDFRREWP